MNFVDAVEVIFYHEGGYVLDPNDPGGETNLGISKRAYPNEDIKNLTKARATALYKRDYWDRNKLDSFPAILRLAVFDCCVNQGAGAAVRCLQIATGALQTGVLTSDLIARTSANPGLMLGKFCMERMKRYHGTKTWDIYGKGWSRRLLAILTVTMVTPTPHRALP